MSPSRFDIPNHTRALANPFEIDCAIRHDYDRGRLWDSLYADVMCRLKTHLQVRRLGHPEPPAARMRETKSAVTAPDFGLSKTVVIHESRLHSVPPFA